MWLVFTELSVGLVNVAMNKSQLFGLIVDGYQHVKTCGFPVVNHESETVLALAECG